MLAEAARGRRSCGSKNRVPSSGPDCTRLGRTGGSPSTSTRTSARAIGCATLVMQHKSMRMRPSEKVTLGSFLLLLFVGLYWAYFK